MFYYITVLVLSIFPIRKPVNRSTDDLVVIHSRKLKKSIQKTTVYVPREYLEKKKVCRYPGVYVNRRHTKINDVCVYIHKL